LTKNRMLSESAAPADRARRARRRVAAQETRDFHDIGEGQQRALLSALQVRVNTSNARCFEDMAVREERTPLAIWIEMCRILGVNRCTIPECVWGPGFVGSA
jgi:hypothetical protein